MLNCTRVYIMYDVISSGTTKRIIKVCINSKQLEGEME